jgi:hypothetical protein
MPYAVAFARRWSAANPNPQPHRQAAIVAHRSQTGRRSQPGPPHRLGSLLIPVLAKPL